MISWSTPSHLLWCNNVDRKVVLDMNLGIFHHWLIALPEKIFTDWWKKKKQRKNRLVWRIERKKEEEEERTTEQILVLYNCPFFKEHKYEKDFSFQTKESYSSKCSSLTMRPLFHSEDQTKSIGAFHSNQWKFTWRNGVWIVVC